MPPYVRFSQSLRPLARVSQLHQHVFRQRETYRRVSTLPCFTLENKVCVVTGASQGLGQQILAAFCLSGGHGAVVDLSLDSAKESIKTINAEVKEKGLPEADLRPYECNTADEAVVKKTWAQIEKDFGKVDVLCTNAGITGGVAAEDYDFNDWKNMLDVNVNGTFLFAKEAGHHMIKQGIKGSIIMVSSMSGVIVNRPQKQSAYNTSKAAVVQMMKSFASEWGEHGIRVNAISPGYIQTAANEGEEMEKLSKEWIKDIPLHRIAKPEEFRGTAVYMASDASSYLTGSQIVVDGGYTVW
ncbi:NAD(P)-binding protein, partial [Aureobasidium melanogenum]